MKFATVEDKLGGRLAGEGRCIVCGGGTKRISPIGHAGVGRPGTYWYMHYVCEPLFKKGADHGHPTT